MVPVFQKFVWLFILAAGSKLAHANISKGPHGGYVKTSEGIHAELVLDPKKGVLVYLMNAKDENPRVEEASIYVLFRTGRYEANIYCAPVKHHFECHVPNPLSRKTGDEISIRATRRGHTSTFLYTFPLDSESETKASTHKP